MGKNNLDMQTFQIYQDDETHDAPSAEVAPKKKKFALPTFGKTKKHKYLNSGDGHSEAVSEGPSHVDVDGSGAAPKISSADASNKADIIKGLGAGFAVVILLIILDQML